MVRLNDRPDMTLDVYRGRKATMQQQEKSNCCFGLAYSLRQARLLKKDKVNVDIQNSIFQVFSAFESFWCPPSMCFGTDTRGIQGHGTGTYKEINIDRIRE